MHSLRHLARHCFALLFYVCMVHVAPACAAAGKEKAQVPTLRWDEQRPGCTFSITQDGKYHYGLWSGDVGSDQNISLEFVKHFHVIQTSLNPDGFSARIQNDADELDHQTMREIEKHPERKETKEAYLRAFQKDVSELLEFLSKNSLRPAELNPANPEISGWVFFNTNIKWISEWKKQEEFVVRLPLDEKIFEFPFRLPPKQGELLLRRRE